MQTENANYAREQGLLTMREAAQAGGVHYNTLKRYVQQRLVRPRYEERPDGFGRRYWFRAEDVEEVRRLFSENVKRMRPGIREYLHQRRGLRAHEGS